MHVLHDACGELAPDKFKAQLQPLATYCYKKYHGGADGYDAVVAAAKANLNPPAGFSIVAAPTNEDLVKKTIAETPDLATLALSDKEFILQYGKPEDAEKVFGTIKGKTTEIPDATVIDGSTADKLMVAVSDDAIQSKTADFTYNMKTPLAKVPATGSKVTLTGTYASYTQNSADDCDGWRRGSGEEGDACEEGSCAAEVVFRIARAAALWGGRFRFWVVAGRGAQV